MEEQINLSLFVDNYSFLLKTTNTNQKNYCHNFLALGIFSKFRRMQLESNHSSPLNNNEGEGDDTAMAATSVAAITETRRVITKKKKKKKTKKEEVAAATTTTTTVNMHMLDHDKNNMELSLLERTAAGDSEMIQVATTTTTTCPTSQGLDGSNPLHPTVLASLEEEEEDDVIHKK